MATTNRINRADRLLVSCPYYARYANGFTSLSAAINDAIQHNITNRNTPDTFRVTNYSKDWSEMYKLTKNGRVRKITK